MRNRLLAVERRCQYRDVNGVQCDETEQLEAAHVRGYGKDGNFDVGTLLCRTHHRMLDAR